MSDHPKPTLSTRQRLLLCGAVLLGVALLVLGKLPSLSVGGQLASSTSKSSDDAVERSEEQRYADALAREIEQLCAAASRGGEVCAVVSLQGGYSYTYAADSEQRVDGATSQSSEAYLTVGSGSAESPVLLYRTPPQIAGIGVVCRGGDTTPGELVALLSTTYGVGSNRIYVILQ